MKDSAETKSEEPTILVNGERLILTTAGAAFWPAEGALIVSDLHFEKSTSYASKGLLLPPYDTRTTLRRLAVLIDRWNPERVISLGDAFHDGGAEARMDADDADALSDLTRKTHWIWISGNHDPAPPARFAGETAGDLRLGGLYFTHEPDIAGPPGEVAGHLHPCARVRTGEQTVRRRCFAVDETRLIMPAFGAYTGGLNVLDDAYRGLFFDFTVWVLGARGVYGFSSAKLAPDAPRPLRVSFG
ncbi:MAG: ligase-associated DNA damage response endonuclease PdeM [Pseudomonadota bacterium]